MPYMTLSQSIRANGDRHAANAQRHRRNGKPEYAAGSMRKAERNWRRAAEMDAHRTVDPRIAAVYNLVLQNIVHNLYRKDRAVVDPMARAFRAQNERHRPRLMNEGE